MYWDICQAIDHEGQKRPTNFFIRQQHSTNNYFQSSHTFCERFFYIPRFFYYISKYLNCCLWMQEREVSMWQWWNVFKAYFYRVLIRSHLLQDATEVVPSDRYTKSDLWKNKLLCCYTFWKMNKLHQKSSQKITQ